MILPLGTGFTNFTPQNTNFKLWKTKIRIPDKNTKLGLWTTKLIVYIGEKDPKQWATICIDLLICWKLKQMDNFKQIGWKCLFLWQFISYRHYLFIVGKIKCCVGKFCFCHFRQSISSSGSKHCWIYLSCGEIKTHMGRFFKNDQANQHILNVLGRCSHCELHS